MTRVAWRGVAWRREVHSGKTSKARGGASHLAVLEATFSSLRHSRIVHQGESGMRHLVVPPPPPARNVTVLAVFYPNCISQFRFRRD